MSYPTSGIGLHGASRRERKRLYDGSGNTTGIGERDREHGDEHREKHRGTSGDGTHEASTGNMTGTRRGTVSGTGGCQASCGTSVKHVAGVGYGITDEDEREQHHGTAVGGEHRDDSSSTSTPQERDGIGHTPARGGRVQEGGRGRATEEAGAAMRR